MVFDLSRPEEAVDNLVGIIGLACRVPGASSSHELSEVLNELKDLRSKIPQERFNIDAFYHPVGSMKGKTNTRHGYFLSQPVDAFDAEFFKISRKEAEAMDPQQRIVLEVVYEALENAGLSLEGISGTDTSVYCGSSTNDYSDVSSSDIAAYPMYTNTGTGPCMMANRVSYFFNLKGTSVYINTACSSSLVCLHMASESIKAGHCEMAIVIGSALHLEPRPFATMADFGMLSAEGRSMAFDASGQGFARGEGVCAVILKRVSLASNDGNCIHAVIRSSFSNHDGASTSLTVPSSEAQIALIRRTYEQAGIATRSTDLIEAHGTGTPVGDPKEAEALTAVFGSDGRSGPIYVGSIKTVLGHLEGAAGLVGAIKAIICVQQGVIFGNREFHRPRSGIVTGKGGISIPTQTMLWPPRHGPRRASVNSFGYGGSNCHCIIEQFMPTSTDLEASSLQLHHSNPYLLPLSSRSKRAGAMFSSHLLQYLSLKPNVTISQVARTLSMGRSVHSQRAYIIAQSRQDLMQGLVDLALDDKWMTASNTVPRLGFIFTGQGSQWASMGTGLLPIAVFSETLDRCQEALNKLPTFSTKWTIKEELLRSKENTKIHSTEFAQPICTAVQIGLVELLRSWEVNPSAVVGHSSGEIAAAYAAGYLDLKSAMLVAHYRGMICSQSFLPRNSSPEGAMLAVGVTVEEVQRLIDPFEGYISIAAINSPYTITLSGDASSIEALSSQLSMQGAFHRKISVERAYHSYHMFSLSKAYYSILASSNITPSLLSTDVSMFSTLTGQQLGSNDVGPQYWVDNLTHSVLFYNAIAHLLTYHKGVPQVDVMVEVGPHPALKGPTLQIIKHLGLSLPYLATMNREKNSLAPLLYTAGNLYQLGYPVNLKTVLCASLCSPTFHRVKLPPRLADFPNYAWEHGHYWYRSRLKGTSLHRSYQHQLLGSLSGVSTSFCKTWRNFLRLRSIPWLAGHKIQNCAVFPAAGFISVAVEAVVRECVQTQDICGLTLENVSIHKPLTIPDNEYGVETLFQLVRSHGSADDNDSEFDFCFSSFQSSNNVSQEHCTGRIQILRKLNNSKIVTREITGQSESASVHDHVLTRDQLYAHFASVGIHYGPEFRLIEDSIRYVSGFARATLPFGASTFLQTEQEEYIVPPNFLDAVLHPLMAATAEATGRLSIDAAIPRSFASIHFSKAFFTEARKERKSSLAIAARSTAMGEHRFRANIALTTQTGSPVISIDELELQKFPQKAKANTLSRTVCGVCWQSAFSFLSKTPRMAPESIFEAVALFCHQFPKARILLLSERPEEDLRQLLRYAGGHDPMYRRFCKITVHSFGNQIQWNNELLDLVETTLCPTQSHDLAIVTSSKWRLLAQPLRSSRYILTNVGFLESGSDVLSSKKSQWKTKDYECLANEPVVQIPTFRKRSVCLIYSHGQEKIQHAVQRCLENTYEAFEILEFSGLQHKMPIKSSDIVVLSSLCDVLLWWNNSDSAVSESTRTLTQEFSAVQNLLVFEKKRIVWLLRSHNFSPTPAAQALITGLLRTVRNENKSTLAMTVDIAVDGNFLTTLTEWLPHLLSSGHHEDEICIRETLQIPRVIPILAIPNLSWSVLPDKGHCVLLIGGFSGLGMAVARFLVRCKFSHLVFFSRSGPSTKAARTLVEDLRRTGVQVDVQQGDVTDLSAVNACVDRFKERLHGVIHMAMVLSDSVFSNMSYEMWNDCVAPKALGAYNVGKATAQLKLDFFICFSSTSGIVGTRGQANYAAANSYLDAYMLERRSLGLPGTSLNIGMVTDAGIVSENHLLQKKMRLLGFTPISIHDVLDQLGTAMTTGTSVLMMDNDGFELHRTISGALSNSTEFFANERSIMQCVSSIAENRASCERNNAVNEMEQVRIDEISDDATRARAISIFLRDTVSKLTDVPLESLDSSRPMVNYGIDSITAQDIKQEVHRATGVEISVFDTLGSSTIHEIGDKINSLISKHEHSDKL